LVALYYEIIKTSVTADCKAQEKNDNVKADHEINWLKEMFSFQLNPSTMSVVSFFCSCVSVGKKDRDFGKHRGNQNEISEQTATTAW